ncbi:MAG: conjugal transfer protein TraR [Ignavibacteriaceae bacterium]|nr:conjugal transfer protein TraR [Ignavibacteriaceae bacterium]
MAKKAKKKTVTKKSSVKKSSKPTTKVKKTVPKKAVKKKVVKKIVAKKAAPKKQASKKVVTKKQAAKKPVVKKKEVKKTKKLVAQKPEMKVKIVKEKPHKTVRRKKQVEEYQYYSTAEARAEALKKIKGYSQKDLEHFRAIILEKRDEIIEQLQNLREQMLDPTTGEYINENSPYSLHMAEQGTDAMEREKTFLYAQRENKFLGYLEDALKRIDNGTYGICVDCIEDPQHLCNTCPLISKERLEAVPHSQACLPMKQKQEKK